MTTLKQFAAYSRAILKVLRYFAYFEPYVGLDQLSQSAILFVLLPYQLYRPIALVYRQLNSF